MSESNGFKVIDVPAPQRGVHSNRWKEIAAKIFALESGKALEISGNQSQIIKSLAYHGLKVNTSKIGERLYAVWRRA